MGGIIELINQHCPNGVKFVNLGDVCTIRTGKLNANAMVEDGEYPFFTCDANPYRIDNYAFDTDAILISGNGSQVGHLHRYNGKFNAYQRTYVLDDFNDALTKDFIYHFLGAYLKPYILVNCKKGSVPYITLPMLQFFKIPVPPIEVQGEIVRILDDFTAVTTNLIETLNEEFIARRKQYECYREIVLDKNENVEWVPLLEISDTFTGLTYKPSDVASSGTIVLRSSNIQNRKLVFDDNVYVQMDNIPQRAIVQEDDILICVRNGSKALIGKAAMIPQHTQPMAFGAFMTILRAKKQVNPKYLFFVWQSPRIQNMIHGESGMPINQITKKMLEQILVPLPTLEEQQKVVEVLEQFDLVYSELSTSLPAEIEARQKQYEYYRDKLLTFKEASE